MNVVVDVGNSSTKWAIAPQADQLYDSAAWKIVRAKHGSPNTWIEALEQEVDWWICSVHTEPTEQLIGWIRQHQPYASIHHVDQTKAGIELLVDEPARVGCDRVMGALAVAKRKKLNEFGIFIDFGTATTVNVVNDRGAFEGGCIIPGVQTQLDSLFDATAQLPKTQWKSEATRPLIGRNTSDAMRSGVARSHWHGVVGLVQQIRNELRMPASVWVTGGGVIDEAMVEAMNGQYIPQLILEGIAIYADSHSAG